MAGLEPARAFCGPTDFKSVASAISPHRRDRLHSTLVIGQTKIFSSRIITAANFPWTVTVPTNESDDHSPMVIIGYAQFTPTIKTLRLHAGLLETPRNSLPSLRGEESSLSPPAWRSAGG
jgi:hypothetical protein